MRLNEMRKLLRSMAKAKMKKWDTLKSIGVWPTEHGERSLDKGHILVFTGKRSRERAVNSPS
jgi:hypothetical protein